MKGAAPRKELLIWETDRWTPVVESILKNLNFTKNGLHHSRFAANFLKVFKKLLHCVNLNQN